MVLEATPKFKKGKRTPRENKMLMRLTGRSASVAKALTNATARVSQRDLHASRPSAFLVRSLEEAPVSRDGDLESRYSASEREGNQRETLISARNVITTHVSLSVAVCRVRMNAADACCCAQTDAASRCNMRS